MFFVILRGVFRLRVRWINVWRTIIIPLAILIDFGLIITLADTGVFDRNPTAWAVALVISVIFLCVALLALSICMAIGGEDFLDGFLRFFSFRWFKDWFMDTYFEDL